MARIPKQRTKGPQGQSMNPKASQIKNPYINDKVNNALDMKDKKQQPPTKVLIAKLNPANYNIIEYYESYFWANKSIGLEGWDPTMQNAIENGEMPLLGGYRWKEVLLYV